MASVGGAKEGADPPLQLPVPAPFPELVDVSKSGESCNEDVEVMKERRSPIVFCFRGK